MINSPEMAQGVAIHGIDPTRESKMTIVVDAITSGSYLNPESRKPEIVMGEALATKLNVRLGEKVVLMVSDIHNEISSAAFRVAGLFRTASPEFQKFNVYILLGKAQELAGYATEINGISVRVQNGLAVEEHATRLRQTLNAPDLEVLTWQQKNPLLVLMLEMFDTSIVVTAIIMFVAVAFTIANSFLMVIYERIQEFGIMMANGVLPKRIRRMLYLEGIIITFIGALVGFAGTLWLVLYFNDGGLDLSNFADGLAMMGIGTLIYPEIWLFDLGVGFGGIFGVVFISILYPAIKASRFEVVDAIRFV